MQTVTSGKLHWLLLSAVVLLLDQLGKSIVMNGLSSYQQLEVLPFFSLTLVYNTGAAFSFLDNAAGWQRWFLIAVAIVVSIMLISWIKQLRSTESWQACALSLILGGALGNLIDRLLHGRVTDFLLLHYKDWYFPAFNLADMAITLGAGVLIFEMLCRSRWAGKN